MSNAVAAPARRRSSAVMTAVFLLVVPLALVLGLAATPGTAKADSTPVGQQDLDNYSNVTQTLISLGFQLREAIVSGNTTLVVNIRFQVTVTVTTVVSSQSDLPFSAPGSTARAASLRF